MTRATRNYLQRVAPASERQVTGAAFVRASTPDDAILASYAVFANPPDPALTGEGLLAWVTRTASASARVAPAALAVGNAVRRQYHHESQAGGQEVVEHWVLFDQRDVILLFVGFVEPTPALNSLVADFDQIAGAAQLRPWPPR